MERDGDNARALSQGELHNGTTGAACGRVHNDNACLNICDDAHEHVGSSAGQAHSRDLVEECVVAQRHQVAQVHCGLFGIRS